MKISSIRANNRKKAFELRAGKRDWTFPYSATRPTPGQADPLIEVFVDKELGGEGFSYRLESGAIGTVHVDHVLEYNRDAGYMADQLLYELTLVARRKIEKSPHSTREIIRRLGTSATQYYRLLDPTNYRKSLRQMITLLAVLDCEVKFVVREIRSA